MKRLFLVLVLVVALLGMGVSPAFAVQEDAFIVWKTGPYPGNYVDWYTLVGHMTMDRTGDVLQVSFWAFEGYELLETHVQASPTLLGIPHNSGGPIPGQFVEGMEHDPAVVGYTYNLDVTGYPETFYVAGHVVMRNIATGQIETGWVTDCNTAQWEFPGRNWARFVLFDGS